MHTERGSEGVGNSRDESTGEEPGGVDFVGGGRGRP